MPSQTAHHDEPGRPESDDALRDRDNEGGRPDGAGGRPDGGAPEDQPDEPGAEGGSKSPAADTLPGAPSDDESAVGDTDQHSTS